MAAGGSVKTPLSPPCAHDKARAELDKLEAALTLGNVDASLTSEPVLKLRSLLNAHRQEHRLPDGAGGGGAGGGGAAGAGCANPTPPGSPSYDVAGNQEMVGGEFDELLMDLMVGNPIASDKEGAEPLFEQSLGRLFQQVPVLQERSERDKLEGKGTISSLQDAVAELKANATFITRTTSHPYHAANELVSIAPDEDTKVQALRAQLISRVEPWALSEFWLRAVLRSEQYDVASSVEVVCGFVGWRKEMGAEHISPLTHPKLEANMRTGKFRITGGKDKVGRAILVIKLRWHDPKAFRCVPRIVTPANAAREIR